MNDNMQSDHQLKTIWVFKTSVSTMMDVRKLKPTLDSLMHHGDKWNFDLEDFDHILRVETLSLPAAVIIEALTNAGYACSELEDNIAIGRFNENQDLAYYSEMIATAG